MTVYFPPNIFARFLLDNFSKDEKEKISFAPSSILSRKLNENSQAVALIPTLELITNKDLFVSDSVGISFEGPLANSYIYFESGRNEIDELKLAGDISSMDVILSKILFKEVYASDIKINIQTKMTQNLHGNHLIAGDENFSEGRHGNGISFAEQIVELVSAPFVGYVLASNNENILRDYSSKFLSKVEKIDYRSNIVLNDFDVQSGGFLKENFSTVIYKFEKQDKAGINELLRLPYYHGLVEDIIDVKFV